MASKTVRRVSECYIKPSCERLSQDAKQPIHLNPFELVLLNHNYSQKGLLFAKPPTQNNHNFSITVFLDDLRRSLSATLTHFYPLAARLATRKGENPPSYVIYIDPENSPGVKFVHATVDASVSEILTSANYVPSVVHSFFDLNNIINHDGHTQPLLSIQVTELTDGVFIAGSVNHLVADGTSFWHFMSAWSQIFTSKHENITHFISPTFTRWFLEGSDTITNLPYTHHDQFIDRHEIPPVKEKFFHFSSAAVSKLKAKANEECNMQKISSLQAVSALLWRCVTRARRQPPDSESVCKLAINNRPRVMKPPLSDGYFGSLIDTIGGSATVEELMAHGLGWAALRIHEVVANYDFAAVRKRAEWWYRNPIVFKLSGVSHPNTVYIGSSPRFDMYGCEFGLGKAVAARSGLMNKSDGGITLYPGREGGGSMDVEICLLHEYMVHLECDEELIIALK